MGREIVLPGCGPPVRLLGMGLRADDSDLDPGADPALEAMFAGGWTCDAQSGDAREGGAAEMTLGA